MAGVRPRDSSKLTDSINDVDQLLYSSDVFDSLWAPDSSTCLHGSETMVNFDGDCGRTDGNQAVVHAADEEEAGEMEDCSGSSLPLSGKKRRLTAGQVELLESNFEAENKLDPERKVQIAAELGLQPRQVAIWFQNRRARFKNKQLEKDCESLRASHNTLKANYEILFKENKRLKLEVQSLKDKMLMKDVKESPEIAPEVFIDNCKQQEDASSAKSDVLDSESPNFAHPSNSDEFDESSLKKSPLGPLLQLPKLEEGYCNDPLGAADFGFSFGGDEDQAFWHWSF